MSNYQTLKNSIKKLESQQHETDNRQFCGVINQDEYEKLAPFTHPAGGNNRLIGYLLVPRRLSEAEWSNKHANQIAI